MGKQDGGRIVLFLQQQRQTRQLALIAVKRRSFVGTMPAGTPERGKSTQERKKPGCENPSSFILTLRSLWAAINSKEPKLHQVSPPEVLSGARLRRFEPRVSFDARSASTYTHSRQRPPHALHPVRVQ